MSETNTILNVLKPIHSYNRINTLLKALTIAAAEHNDKLYKQLTILYNYRQKNLVDSFHTKKKQIFSMLSSGRRQNSGARHQVGGDTNTNSDLTFGDVGVIATHMLNVVKNIEKYNDASLLLTTKNANVGRIVI